MNQMRCKILVLLLSFAFIRVNAQNGKECINEVIQLEEEFYTGEYKEGEKPIHLSYHIRTRDWEEQTVASNVDVYRDKYNMHFFSDQANIYQDEKDVFLVLRGQKLIVINSTKKEMNDQQFSSEFLELKKEFLLNAEVVKCEISKKDAFLKILELKIKDDTDGAINIDRMIFEYNTKTKKIISSKIYYNKEYKVKEIVINYNELDKQSDYKFNSARKYVLNRNDKLLDKYKGCELVDNREKK